VQKKSSAKYILYKAVFSLVLCGFFFVQSNASFIAHSYNDFEAPHGSHFFHNHPQPKASVVKAKGGTHTKYKLNKRFQPVTSPALLPPGIFLPPLYYAVAACKTVMQQRAVPTAFLLVKKQRGPPKQ
jgi:hypothetical protein